MSTTTKPKHELTCRTFEVHSVQSPPSRRTYLLSTWIDGGKAGIQAYDVLAIRTRTYVRCTKRTPEGQYPSDPASIEQARHDGWRINPPETESEPILIDDEYGLLNGTDLITATNVKHRYIVARGDESGDDDVLAQAGLAMLKEQAADLKMESDSLEVEFSFSGGITPFGGKIVFRSAADRLALQS